MKIEITPGVALALGGVFVAAASIWLKAELTTERQTTAAWRATMEERHKESMEWRKKMETKISELSKDVSGLNSKLTAIEKVQTNYMANDRARYDRYGWGRYKAK